MAIESQKVNEKELQEEVPKKTLETSPFKHPLTEQLLYKPPPPLRPSLQPSPENSAAIEEPRKEDEAPKEIKSPGAEISMGSSETSDLQKKVRRAERFGMPVQLSEEEKRNSRAERFGTAPTLHGSDGNRKSEEQKRKARAERFGLAAHSTSDEEAKKKARVARFGSGPKPDTLEEDKRKARAIRFSETSPSAPSQTNGKANSELKVTVASKTGGGD